MSYSRSGITRRRPVVYGIDFTSAPSARKPITVGCGRIEGNGLSIGRIEKLQSLAEFESFLARPGPWVGGFDFPFGIAREAVIALGWPQVWAQMLAHCRSLGRAEFKRRLDAYRESRPAGARYAARRGDAASGAHPSVKLVNPPVGFMFLEGAPRLAGAGLHIPGLQTGDATRVALEAYPGMLVRKQLGIRDSYKSDTPGAWNARRKAVRRRVLRALKAGQPLGTRVALAAAVERAALADGMGDALDAVICALQAHWGWLRRRTNYGLPADLDCLEGWIVTS